MKARLGSTILVAVIAAAAPARADRATDFSPQAAAQRVATCTANVVDSASCHAQFPTGCSNSTHPAYDAYLNFLKNQLTPPATAPAGTLAEADINRLEAAVPDTLTTRNHAALASQLAALGEGNVYALSGYLYFVDKTTSKETSNCQVNGGENTDYHIGIGFDQALAQQMEEAGSRVPPGLLKQAQQSSVVVEMTPHYRQRFYPAWSSTAIAPFVGHQVKVFGQLLLDNEHYKPSDDCGHPDADEHSCWRASSWELHPVTQFLTCSSTDCSGGGWQPISPTPASIAGSHAPSGLPPSPFDARILSIAQDQSLLTAVPLPRTEPVTPVSLTVPSGDARTALKALAPGDMAVVHAAPPAAGDPTGAPPRATGIAQKTVSPTAFQRGATILLSALAVLALAALLLGRRAPGLIVGEDKRYSKSKFQMAIWFWMLLSAYLGTLALRGIMSGWEVVGGVGVPPNLVLLSGLSGLTFVGAKSITQRRAAANLKPPADRPPMFPDDLVNDDSNNPDLGDFQMVVLTVVAVITYIAIVLSWWKQLPLVATTLPDVDTTILAVVGVGHGAYLVKKQVSG